MSRSDFDKHCSFLCLELNADGLPWSVKPWKKAQGVLMKERCTVLVEYPAPIAGKIDFTTGEQTFFTRPAVIALRKYVSPRERKIKYSKSNVFIRDKFKCVYCGCQCSYSERNPPTIDHVIPRSLGGGLDFMNCVTCCMSCNFKKGKFLVEEAGMRLRIKPFIPEYLPPVKLLNFAASYCIGYWFQGLEKKYVTLFKDFAKWMAISPPLKKSILEWEK